MRDSEFCVYKHTSPSGKIYIGITSLNPERRWRKGLGYKDQPYFYNAILKYGWDNFKHEILYSGLTHDEACSLEKELIKQYKATDSNYGYNLSSGGPCGGLGVKNSEEVRKRKSESAKLAWSNPGRKRFAIGENVKRKRNDPRYTGLGHKKSKVNQFTMDGEHICTWSSLCEIERVLGIPTGKISECCHGKRLSVKGYKWSFVEVVV